MGSPVAFTGSGKTLILAGTSTLTGKSGTAAMRVAGTAALTISGSGSLHATGGLDAAGIGGNNEQGGGRISITGGTVNATGSYGSAGIGGGYAGNGGDDILISGGTVTAQAVRAARALAVESVAKQRLQPVSPFRAEM